MRKFISSFLVPIFLTLILLDLNEFLARFTGSEGILSNLILLLSFVIFAFSITKSRISNPWYTSFLVAMSIFIFFGGLSIFQSEGIGELSEQIRYYAPSFIIFLVIYRYGVSLLKFSEFSHTLYIIAVLIGINGVLVIISIFFDIDFHRSGVDEVDRAVGLYSNANRAGYVCALGQSLAMYLLLSKDYGKHQVILLGVFLVLILAALSTFSKGASTITFVLIIRFFYTISRNKSNRFKSRRVINFAIFFLVFGFSFAAFRFSTIQQGLSNEQLARTNQLYDLYSGTIDAQTTTHRSELGSYAFSKIQEQIILGHGLGKFHMMDIGYGAHNVYLLIWGESGFFGLIAYLIFLITWFQFRKKISDPALRMLIINVLLIFFLSGFTAHTLLVNKPYLTILGAVMAGSSLFLKQKRYLKQKRIFENAQNIQTNV